MGPVVVCTRECGGVYDIWEGSQGGDTVVRVGISAQLDNGGVTHRTGAEMWGYMTTRDGI